MSPRKQLTSFVECHSYSVVLGISSLWFVQLIIIVRVRSFSNKVAILCLEGTENYFVEGHMTSFSGHISAREKKTDFWVVKQPVLPVR